MTFENKYTYDEAFQTSLPFLGGDERLTRVWLNQYAQKDQQGRLVENTPDDMLWSLAKELEEEQLKNARQLTTSEMHDYIARFFHQRRAQDVNADFCLQHAVCDKQPQVTEVRPRELECDVVRFQNNKEKWVALVGLLNGYPYEIFTGLQDDDEGIMLPKSVTKGKIVKQVNPDGTKRYDFQFTNTRGYKITVEGLSEKFNPEYWNYAKLISGVLRYRMPIEHVIKLVSSLQLKDESINTWKNGVERALKKYLGDGSETAETEADGDRE
jgi:hypothetical protein